MKIEINFQKKHIYLASILLIILFGISVYSLGNDQQWHILNELFVGSNSIDQNSNGLVDNAETALASSSAPYIDNIKGYKFFFWGGYYQNKLCYNLTDPVSQPPATYGYSYTCNQYIVHLWGSNNRKQYT